MSGTVMRAILFSAVLAACTIPQPMDGIGADAADEAAEGAPDEGTPNDAVDDDEIEIDSDDIAAKAKIPTPIKYIVVIVKENHSFDNYFMDFPGAVSSATAKLHNGKTLKRKRAPVDLGGDMSHSHTSAVKDYDGGKMDGFDTIVEDEPHRPFYYYAESQIPNYWAYAKHFVLFDHFFSTLAGPSSPGHFAVITGQTPHYANPSCDDGSDECGHGCVNPDPALYVDTYNRKTGKTSTHEPCFNVPTVIDHLPAGYTWKTYSHGNDPDAMNTAFNMVKSVGGHKAERDAHFATYAQLDEDLSEGGTQANFTHVDVSVAPHGASEHPPNNPCEGENFTVNVINKIMRGPHWKQTAIIVTWDDFGGWYDHVKPNVEKLENGKFFNTGFRVPALVISPYARRKVAKKHTEHASVPKLVEELWGLPMMSETDEHARDGRAGSMMGAFDFDQAPRAPLILTPRTCPGT